MQSSARLLILRTQVAIFSQYSQFYFCNQTIFVVFSYFKNHGFFVLKNHYLNRDLLDSGASGAMAPPLFQILQCNLVPLAEKGSFKKCRIK